MGKVNRANIRGKRLEGIISELLGEKYTFVPSKKFKQSKALKKPVFSKQFSVGTNIYGKKRVVDFILYHPVRWPNCLAIQCKWQSVSGSVEEKYPFEVMSIEEGDYDTIIVLDGGGYSPGSEEWLKSQAMGISRTRKSRSSLQTQKRLLDVLNLGEITRLLSKGKL